MTSHQADTLHTLYSEVAACYGRISELEAMVEATKNGQKVAPAKRQSPARRKAPAAAAPQSETSQSETPPATQPKRSRSRRSGSAKPEKTPEATSE